MIRIITDSAADFEPAELNRLGISCIPLTVVFGETEYQENVNLSKNQFYQMLMQTEEFPQTAQASPQILINLFEEAHARGDEAVYITLASQLSGTYQNAVMARDMLGYGSCFVVDSCNATGGQRMLVEYAVKLRDEGKSAPQIVEAVQTLRDRIVLYACVDTLEYLYRGGRISHVAYRLGSFAQIKPILRVEVDGHLTVPSKVIGMRKGMDFLCKQLDTVERDDAFPMYVMYTAERKNGAVLAQRLRRKGIDIADEQIINVGAAIGTHVGPNACGLVYVAREKGGN